MNLDRDEALDFLDKKLHEHGATLKYPEKTLKHSIAICDQSVLLAEKVKEKGWDLDIGLVAAGAILHDVGRKVTQRIDHGYAGSIILAQAGWGAQVSNIAANHVLINRDLACRLSIPKQHYAPFTLEEAIITFVDKCTSEDALVGLEGRRKQLEQKYKGTPEGHGWYEEWSSFSEPESREIQAQVEGYLIARGTQSPSFKDALDLLRTSFSRIRDPRKREGIAKHSLGVCAYSRMIGQNVGLDDETLELVAYAGLLHDVGRGSAWAVEHPLVGKLILEPRGYPAEVVRATIGHCIFPDALAEKLHFPKPWDAYRPQTFMEEILTYADKRVYLDQFLPDCETRLRIWDKLYSGGENYPLWSPQVRTGLERIEEKLDHTSFLVSCTAKDISHEIEALLGQYGITAQKAYNSLGIADPVITPFKSIVDI